MAALKTIHAGKKLYHVFGGHSRDKFTCKRKKTVTTIYVLEVDREGERVLASVNGLPATWVKRTAYGRWKHSNPLLQNNKKTA